MHALTQYMHTRMHTNTTLTHTARIHRTPFGRSSTVFNKTHTHTYWDTDTGTETQTHKHKHGDTHTQIHTHRQTCLHNHTDRHKHTHTQAHRHNEVSEGTIDWAPFGHCVAPFNPPGLSRRSRRKHLDMADGQSVSHLDTWKQSLKHSSEWKSL